MIPENMAVIDKFCEKSCLPANVSQTRPAPIISIRRYLFSYKLKNNRKSLNEKAEKRLQMQRFGTKTKVQNY
jgi:hypothetical protein